MLSIDRTGRLGVVPPLDATFQPLALANRAFRQAVADAGDGVPVAIAVERGDGSISRYDTLIHPLNAPAALANHAYIARMVKTLLWARGGWKVYIGGPMEVGMAIAAMYAPDGARAFDAELMGRVYERPFTVVACEYCNVPAAQESTVAVGGHLDGCRIGIDLGASDRKAAAVLDGVPVYSEEVIWDPRPQTDPQYHYEEIMTGMRTAAAYLPRVDAIGISSAGVYVNNRIMIASLFRGITDLYKQRVTDLFLDIQRAWDNVPLVVMNDGEVTALAGAMTLHDTAILGVAMGSSEAAGYVTPSGALTNWLNELAFAPIDVNPNAPVDEWSGDTGCGVQYLSQQAVGRLLPLAGFPVESGLSLPEQLKCLQRAMSDGDVRARAVYDTIGVYLGYALAHYADVYDYRHALILGRVTSGDGGTVILAKAYEVLSRDFPELSLQLHLPDESERRVGQAIAAASLCARVA